MMNDRDHYEYDDRDNCPLCNRCESTCRCSDGELEAWREECEDSSWYEDQNEMYGRGYD